MRVFFLNGGIGDMISAIERSSMQRGMLFKQFFDIDVTYVTLDYEAQQGRLFQKYARRNLLHPGNTFLNMYDYFQDIHRKPDTPYAPPPLRETLPGTITPIPGKRDIWIKDARGSARHFVKYRDDEKVDYVNHYKNNKLVRSDKYDEDGFLSKTTIVNKDSKILSALYYRPEGTLALQEYFEVKDTPSEIVNIQIINAVGKHVDTVKDRDELMVRWLSTGLFDGEEPAFCVLDRSYRYAPFFLETPKDALKNIFSVPVLHSIHYAYGTDIHSKANSHYSSFIDKHCEHDALVTLTDRQNADISQRLGVNNVYTVPHVIHERPAHAAPAPPQVPAMTPQGNIVVLVARLVPCKQHGEALEIFKRVVAEVPDAQLYIYGRGTEEDALRQKIADLSLENNVVLAGYTDGVSAVFQQATLSLLTSLFEGFSLSILESMAQGCPVVSYDVRYGPAELIVHGENGYLVPPIDFLTFAEHIISVLKNPDLRSRLSAHAVRHVYERFSPEIVAQKWENIMNIAASTFRRRAS